MTAGLLDRAVGWRQGVIAELRPVPRSLADLDVPGWAAVAEPFRAGGTSGGAGPHAREAAIAEAMERHAAATCPLESRPVPENAVHWPIEDFTLHSPAQRAHRNFPYRYEDPGYTRAWTLPGNAEIWVPAGLVGLRPEHGLPATSSGLAAGPSTVHALLRATQELIERDALTVSWLHSLAPARIPVPAALREPVESLGGRVHAFDLTPGYSPHPVIAVAGTLPLGGRPRSTLGLACRADAGEALEKAWLEWTQGTVFLEVWLAGNEKTVLKPRQVTDFDAHAAYYTSRPREWDRLPWWRGPVGTAPVSSPARGTAAELAELVRALRRHRIRLAYRELTTPELAAVGLNAVRVLSPELTPLHSDHRWPFLGGTTADLARRFPDAKPGVFPNPHPHPLG
ncbi:YcaO-like family protein [Amycolatopsis sp. CA-230715]|uniref:YcaO-like family protein n=1 Tax=Amycolatopsis sp. CA-230715 TaxID=2745196 RepID=UPI001C022332|nr:YcaO-like family protein [Amycolatopsis sp. CA-230715]QWF77055.1 hypothetical protein HUW46_00435 [Amycolatopsis sp. CA-230715]